MIPVRLHIAGFLSYQDPVELDFTTFDLACISGSNGAGKSSLLDAITWALFGIARRRDDTVINSHAETAEVIYDFLYEEGLYRVQRAKPRGKGTVLEFFIRAANGDWKPLTEKSVHITEARIRDILRMDYETFINASFLLQGKADQFAQQRPADRKRVLSAILGLEIWELYRADAAERRKGVEADCKSFDAQIDEIDGELAQENARKDRLKEALIRLEQTSQIRQAKESVLLSLQKLAATLNEQRRVVEMLEGTVDETRARVNRLQTDLADLSNERAQAQQALAQADVLQKEYARWQELRATLEEWEGVAANFREVEARRSGPVTAIAAEASRMDQERRTLFLQENTVQQEQARLTEIQAQRAQLAESIQQMEAQLNGRAALEAELHTVQADAAEAQVENRTLRDAMKALKERIDRLNETSGAVCPLCGQPLIPEERANLIMGLESEGKEMGDRYRANLEVQAQAENQVRDLQSQVQALTRAQDGLRTQARQHDRLESDLQRIEADQAAWNANGAQRLTALNRMLAEEDFAQTARAELAEIDAQSRALGYDSAAHDAVRKAELAARKVEGELGALEAARAALGPLERQISGLEEQRTRETARLAEQSRAYETAHANYENEAANLPDLNQTERELFDIQSQENTLRMEVGMLRQGVSILATQRARRAKLSDQRSSLTEQITRLKMLERAFSKDGVPALLIEQALPEIETQANEMLDRLSNGGMSIHFETQRQFKDKKRDDLRETLDILISDSAGLREYELFSGGEAFRINFAIRLALSRVLAQRAGARLQTLVIDEGFGSQDVEGRQRLIEAINLVRNDFKKVLVITHLEELKEAFPTRIEVEKTLHGSRVRVIA